MEITSLLRLGATLKTAMWAYLNGSDNTWPSERKHASPWIIMNVPFDTPVDVAGVAEYGDNISLIRAFPCPQIQTNMPSVCELDRTSILLSSKSKVRLSVP